MNSNEIRQKFLDFFEKNGHQVIPSSSLVPENDNSVLFTTAGMQQFKPYFVGSKNAEEAFGGKNTTSSQKCVRTSDIEEIGDDTHLTFFEMLGNFSFGGYWKEEAIKYAYEFIKKELKLEIDYVSVFEGDSETPEDKESREIWQRIDSKLTIKNHNREDNFWGPTGNEGPCGPTTEIYVNGIEIWNIVFNEYYKDKNGKYEPLKTKGVDTGMGLERLLVQVDNKKNVYETDLFLPLMSALAENGQILDMKTKRIVADHIRTAVFLISDGVVPSNKDRGYVLRRLLRRTLAVEARFDISPQFFESLIIKVLEIYSNSYPSLMSNRKDIINTYFAESIKFNSTLTQGLKELDKHPEINADVAFKLYESFGLPFEVIKDAAPDKTKNLTNEDFDKKFKEHQEESRKGTRQKIK